tara:strand:+ start:44 stop:166 length:123 start_codon:yes stop_codon:yes gene_type:complete
MLKLVLSRTKDKKLFVQGLKVGMEKEAKPLGEDGAVVGFN